MPHVTILPCLDLKDGRIVKGVHFTQLRDAGDPLLAAQAYAEDGATELVILDITATIEHRKTTLNTLESIVNATSLAVTVGGGIRSVEDARAVFNAGARRITVSSAAVRQPDLVADLIASFGSDAIGVAIDVEQTNNTPSQYEVMIDGGRTATSIDAIAWAKQMNDVGVGLLLPTSKTTDGAKQGYDIPLIETLRRHITTPLVASGGAGKLEHFAQAAKAGANYILAASVFHFGEIRIADLKQYLQQNGISCR